MVKKENWGQYHSWLIKKRYKTYGIQDFVSQIRYTGQHCNTNLSHQCIVKIIIYVQNYLITLSSRNMQCKFPLIGTFTKKTKNIRKNHDLVRSVKLTEISRLGYIDKIIFNHLWSK